MKKICLFYAENDAIIKSRFWNQKKMFCLD